MSHSGEEVERRLGAPETFSRRRVDTADENRVMGLRDLGGNPSETRRLATISLDLTHNLITALDDDSCGTLTILPADAADTTEARRSWSSSYLIFRSTRILSVTSEDYLTSD